jgi:phytoene dehydrogenase-like protein
MAILSAMDPSQAPEGQDVAQLYAPVPVEPRDGWPAARVEAADALVHAVSTAAPALKDLEIGRYVETPEDLTARTGTVRGSLYHVDHVPTRMGPLRPALGVGGYRTPLTGLYLSGAGTHPQGGVSGLPGKLSAQTLLRDGVRAGTRRSHNRSHGTAWAVPSNSSADGAASAARSHGRPSAGDNRS